VLDVAAQQAVETVDAPDVLELVEGDQRAVAPGLLEAERQLEQGVEGRERILHRLELELGADAEGAEREPDPRPLEERLHPPPEVAFQLLRVRALEPHRDVADRRDAVEVDEHGDEPFGALPVVQGALEEARLAVLAGRVEPHVVAADDVPEELPHLVLAVDDVLGRDRPRVDERIDVDDHAPVKLPDSSHSDYYRVVRGTHGPQALWATYQPTSTS
jgi:hypothetical protein